MAKEATNPKPSMRREWYCLAVHKSTRERTFEHAGAEEQTVEKVGFCHLSSFFLIQTLDLHSLQTKADIELLHAQNDIAFVAAAPFSPFACKLARVAVLASCGSTKLEHDAILSNKQGRGSDVYLLRMRSSHANAFTALRYMTIMELFDEYPLLLWDDDDSHWSRHQHYNFILNDILSERSTKACCWRE